MNKGMKAKLKDIADKYTYKVHWSGEDEVYICGTAELPSVLCHADSAEAALKEGKKVVLDTLLELEENGEQIPEPFSLRSFSGKFVVRTTEDLHRKLTIEAQEKGVSLNKLANDKLSG